MGAWAGEVAVVCLVVMFTSCVLSYKMDLATLLKQHNRQQAAAAKRTYDELDRENQRPGGNPCSKPETPFPCKGSQTCIPMGYVCDDNWDCEDGYDEDEEVCTAIIRPPVVDIMHFLDNEKGWINALFGKTQIHKIAHGLAVSQTVSDFKRRVGLSKQEVKNLKLALEAVRNNDETALESLGMPNSAWQEVSFIFGKLIKSGFN